MPIWRTTLHTGLPHQEVELRIRTLVRAPLTWRQRLRYIPEGARQKALFEGTVGSNSFKITRLISYHNSFLPIVRGAVVPRTTGTDIKVLMHLHPLVAAFMVVWLCAVGSSIPDAFNGSSEAFQSIPFGMFVFGLVLPVAGFLPEAVAATRQLRKHLGAA
jgi:hypothetical protein